MEERAIPAVAPRRRPLIQARRLIPQRKPAIRYLGPLIVAGLGLGLALGIALFVMVPTPESPPVESAPTADAAGPATEGPLTGAAGEIREGVPVQATEAPLAPSAPTPDPRVVNEQKLREAVFAPFREVRGRYGIFVKDLATGQSVVLNEHYPFQAASLYKLPVMYEVFKSRDLDIFALSEELTIGPDDAAMDLGSLPWPVGTRITIGTALERMVTISDNSGAFMLAKKVGSSKINDDMASLGLYRTHIRGEELQTSAYDMARLLEIIARGQALSPQTSAEMVHLMARQQVRNRIPVLMPPEATVANKTGNWEAAAHDVAIVYGPRATIVIVFLADGIGDFDGLYTAMATAARNVYDLVNDPSFGSSADPPLPRNEVASYQSPARLPGSSSSAPSSTRSAAPSEKPRPAAPAPRVSAPADPTPAPRPAEKPAAKPADASVEKPADRPSADKPAAKPADKMDEAPAIKPQAPSIFVVPTKTP